MRKINSPPKEFGRDPSPPYSPPLILLGEFPPSKFKNSSKILKDPTVSNFKTLTSKYHFSNAKKCHNRILVHYADILQAAIHHYHTCASFLPNVCSSQVSKNIWNIFLEPLAGKFVKNVVQPSSSFQEHPLQPSSPFVATIVTAKILYIK